MATAHSRSYRYDKMAAHSQDAPSDVETLPFVVGMVDVGLSQSLASTPGAGTVTNESITKEVCLSRHFIVLTIC